MLKRSEREKHFEIQSQLSDEAKQLRKQFAQLQLQKLDAQIRRGTITPAPSGHNAGARTDAKETQG